ncbi:MAG: Cys-tRNA(Pro) deacylase [Lachnospiraceae bacterium]|nr:Cys-tRNA(Pro) deacylase [Lachnospiraceae bacterium]
MGKEKEIKTNAMRILDKKKITYQVNSYTCEEFIDGVHIADKLGQSYEQSFKTLVAVGKSKEHYVFVIPVDKEIDFKKAAKVVGEKSIELVPVKEIQGLTGYIRGGCTPIGMKKLFKTIIQESAKEHKEIIISGGKLGLQILLNPEDLIMVVNGEYGDVIA